MPEAAPDTNEAIRRELEAANVALERFVADATSQQQRLRALEERIQRVELLLENLKESQSAILDSRIWKTLVKCARVVEKIVGRSRSAS